MGKARVITLILGIIAILGMAPHIVYSDYKQTTTTEEILFKKESVTSEGTPRYHFILDKTGALAVTPQAFYSFEKGQTFTYYNTMTKSQIIQKAYAGFFILSVFFGLLFCFYKLFTTEF